jgi:hypothetical protein
MLFVIVEQDSGASLEVCVILQIIVKRANALEDAFIRLLTLSPVRYSYLNNRTRGILCN